MNHRLWRCLSLLLLGWFNTFGCQSEPKIDQPARDASVAQGSVDAMWVGREQTETFRVVPEHTPQSTSSTLVVTPTAYVRDLRRSEAAAATAAKVLKRWCEADASPPLNEWRATLSPYFKATWFDAMATQKERLSIAVRKAQPLDRYQANEEFQKAWQGLTQGWLSERCAIR